MDAIAVAFAGIARQAELVAAGEISSQELVELYLERIGRLDIKLNAFRVVLGERALLEARQADGRRGAGERRPLNGVPVAVKDDIDLAGEVTAFGTNAHGPAVAEDAEVVKRLRRAGAVVIGKTNVPELTIWPFTESATFGVTRNPWDEQRAPGGSSGGSAAAVAARLAPAALGTDTGGSIRVPASLCGITSMRPTTLRWPQSGILPLSHTRDTAGPMARHVADCVLLDGVITGGPTEVAPAALKGLRLGLPRGYFWENLDAELAAILEAALARLREAGVVAGRGRRCQCRRARRRRRLSHHALRDGDRARAVSGRA
jgi:Asp-tRNA(Asn)/Glu-tRNA(Gln) amidotransferase A subunit family amidase